MSLELNFLVEKIKKLSDALAPARAIIEPNKSRLESFQPDQQLENCLYPQLLNPTKFEIALQELRDELSKNVDRDIRIGSKRRRTSFCAEWAKQTLKLIESVIVTADSNLRDICIFQLCWGAKSFQGCLLQNLLDQIDQPIPPAQPTPPEQLAWAKTLLWTIQTLTDERLTPLRHLVLGALRKIFASTSFTRFWNEFGIGKEHKVFLNDSQKYVHKNQSIGLMQNSLKIRFKHHKQSINLQKSECKIKETLWNALILLLLQQQERTVRLPGRIALNLFQKAAQVNGAPTLLSVILARKIDKRIEGIELQNRWWERLLRRLKKNSHVRIMIAWLNETKHPNMEYLCFEHVDLIENNNWYPSLCLAILIFHILVARHVFSQGDVNFVRSFFSRLKGGGALEFALGKKLIMFFSSSIVTKFTNSTIIAKPFHAWLEYLNINQTNEQNCLESVILLGKIIRENFKIQSAAQFAVIFIRFQTWKKLTSYIIKNSNWETHNYILSSMPPFNAIYNLREILRSLPKINHLPTSTVLRLFQGRIAKKETNISKLLQARWAELVMDYLTLFPHLIIEFGVKLETLLPRLNIDSRLVLKWLKIVNFYSPQPHSITRSLSRQRPIREHRTVLIWIAIFICRSAIIPDQNLLELATQLDIQFNDHINQNKFNWAHILPNLPLNALEQTIKLFFFSQANIYNKKSFSRIFDSKTLQDLKECLNDLIPELKINLSVETIELSEKFFKKVISILPNASSKFWRLILQSDAFVLEKTFKRYEEQFLNNNKLFKNLFAEKWITKRLKRELGLINYTKNIDLVCNKLESQKMSLESNLVQQIDADYAFSSQVKLLELLELRMRNKTNSSQLNENKNITITGNQIKCLLLRIDREIEINKISSQSLTRAAIWLIRRDLEIHYPFMNTSIQENILSDNQIKRLTEIYQLSLILKLLRHSTFEIAGADLFQRQVIPLMLSCTCHSLAFAMVCAEMIDALVRYQLKRKDASSKDLQNELLVLWMNACRILCPCQDPLLRLLNYDITDEFCIQILETESKTLLKEFRERTVQVVGVIACQVQQNAAQSLNWLAALKSSCEIPLYVFIAEKLEILGSTEVYPSSEFVNAGPTVRRTWLSMWRLMNHPICKAFRRKNVSIKDCKRLLIFGCKMHIYEHLAMQLHAEERRAVVPWDTKKKARIVPPDLFWVAALLVLESNLDWEITDWATARTRSAVAEASLVLGAAARSNSRSEFVVRMRRLAAKTLPQLAAKARVAGVLPLRANFAAFIAFAATAAFSSSPGEAPN